MPANRALVMCLGPATLSQIFLATETNDHGTRTTDDRSGPQVNPGSMTAQRTTGSFLSPKQVCRIGTWNVRTMFEAGKTAQVEREMTGYNIDILGVSECRWTGNGSLTTAQGTTIVYSGREDGNHREGVAILMSKKAKKSLMEWKPINSRLISARFFSKYVKITIIQCYAPISDADDETKDEFYQTLQKEVDSTPTHDVLLVTGDLNAKVGSSNIGRQRTMGTCGCGVMNENGQRLADFCEENDLVIGGTIFQHRKIHKETWISPDGRTKNQIDHVLINGKWRHSLEDVKVRRGADVGSDHHLILAKVKLHLRTAPNRTESVQQRYDTAKLKNPAFSKQFCITLKNRYRALNNIGDVTENVESHWNSVCKSYTEACKEVLGRKERKHKVWISMDSWDLINLRKTLKEKKSNAKSERLKNKLSAEYSQVNKDVKKRLRQDKRNYYEDLATEAEQAAERGAISEVYRITRQMTNKFSNSGGTVKDKEGRKITLESKQLQRWAEHFREVLNRPEPNTRATFEEEETVLNVDCSPPTKEEIAKAISKLKSNRAPGIDGLTGEILKADTQFAVEALHRLFLKIWDAEEIPTDWCKGLIAKIPKKGNKEECSNWRGVTLLSVPSKVFCKVIQSRLSKAIDSTLRKEQAGFRPGHSCIDHIFTLRNILEQCIEWNSKVHVNFIDFQKAFDSVHRDSLWKILSAYGCPSKFVNIIRLFYKNFTCSVIHNGNLSEWFSITSGVRQGCILSPMLFLLAVDWVMRKTVGNKQRGIRWTLFSMLEDIDFADDIALLSTTGQQLQKKTDDMNKHALQIGLTISQSKTKTMQLTDRPPTITLNDTDIEEVEEFTYLGSIVGKKDATAKDVTNRLKKARAAFAHLRNIWRSKTLKEKTKIRIYKSNVLSVLLYGSECWRDIQRDSHRLHVFHTSCLRRICRIYWEQRISNEAVYERTGQRSINSIIKQRRWKWLGHVLRRDKNSITRTALHWTPDGGKRRRGRPLETWRRTVDKEIKEMGKTWGEIEKIAANRTEWRALVNALCAR